MIAVGRLRPPYQDDVEHYRKMLAGPREDRSDRGTRGRAGGARVPDRAFRVLLASDGELFDSEGFAAWLEERRHDARDVCFVIGGPKGLDLQADLRLSLGPMTLPAPARPGGPAGADLPGAQDPRPRAVPLLNALSLMAVSDPVSELRGAVSDAAADLRANGALDGAKLDRPPRADFGDYSTNAAMLLAPYDGRGAAGDRRAARRGARRAAGHGGRARGDRRAGLPQPVHDRRLVPRVARRDPRRRRSLRRRRRRGARAGRVRQRQPDRADHRRRRARTPPTATRWRASSSSPATSSSASTTSTTPAPRCTSSARRSALGRAARSPRSTGATTWPTWPSASRVPPTATRTSSPQRGIELMLEEIEATLQRFRVQHGPLLLGAIAARVGRRRKRAGAARGRIRVRRRPLAADHRARRRQGPRAAPLDRGARLLRRDIAYHADKLVARLRPADQRARLRPPRLREADLRRLGGARRRSGRLRDRDDAAGPPVRGRQARADVEARGGIVTLDALVDDIGVDAARWYLRRAATTPRSTSTSSWRAPSPGQPRLLRAVRARPDRVDPAQGGGGARGRRARRRTCSRARSASTRRRARWSSGCSSSRPRCRRRPSAAPRTG